MHLGIDPAAAAHTAAQADVAAVGTSAAASEMPDDPVDPADSSTAKSPLAAAEAAAAHANFLALKAGPCAPPHFELVCKLFGTWVFILSTFIEPQGASYDEHQPTPSKYSIWSGQTLSYSLSGFSCMNLGYPM